MAERLLFSFGIAAFAGGHWPPVFEWSFDRGDRRVDPRSVLRTLDQPFWPESAAGVLIIKPGATDSVGVVARRLLFSRPCARVSILWGDPVGESGGGGRAIRWMSAGGGAGRDGGRDGVAKDVN